MLRAIAGLALGLLACTTEAEVEPRAPPRTPPVESCALGVPVADSFPAQFARSQEDVAPRERPRSIDLGQIGDEPLGRNGTPVHVVPAWQRPFPCHWTHTCAQQVYLLMPVRAAVPQD